MPHYKQTYIQVNRHTYGDSYKNADMEKFTFGERLKLARKHANLSQTALAKKVGMSQPNLSGLETGEFTSSALTVELAYACNVNARWLSSGKGEMVRQNDGWPFLTSKSDFDALSENDKKTLDAMVTGFVRGSLNKSGNTPA